MWHIFGRFFKNKVEFFLSLITHHFMEFHASLTSAAGRVCGHLHASAALLPEI
jgi:hypothetical protein